MHSKTSQDTLSQTVGMGLIQSQLARNMGFPGGSDGKESACNVGDLGSIPEL